MQIDYCIHQSATHILHRFIPFRFLLITLRLLFTALFRFFPTFCHCDSIIFMHMQCWISKEKNRDKITIVNVYFLFWLYPFQFPPKFGIALALHCTCTLVIGNCQRSENISTSGDKIGYEKTKTKLCQVRNNMTLLLIELFHFDLSCNFFSFEIEICSCSPHHVWVFLCIPKWRCDWIGAIFIIVLFIILFSRFFFFLAYWLEIIKRHHMQNACVSWRATAHQILTRSNIQNERKEEK